MKLEPHHIHLWVVDTRDYVFQELRALTASWLSERDSQRLDRFHFVEHKHQLLLGRYLLHTVLSRYETLAPAEWRFDYNEYGKPFIARKLAEKMTRPLYFNLSHSRNKLVLAVARHQFLGVDIEYGLKPRRVEKIAERYFSSVEIAGFASLAEGQLQQRFYDLWSLKEAYIKACGMGLAIPLDQFSYSFHEDNKIEIAFDDARDDDSEFWQFWQLESEPDYHLALAIKKEEAATVVVSKFYQLMPQGELVSKKLLIGKVSKQSLVNRRS